MLLIGCAVRKFCFKQSKALPRSGSDMSSVWNFCHQYRLSAVVPQKSFRGKTVNNIVKCQLFSKAKFCPLPSFAFHVFTLCIKSAILKIVVVVVVVVSLLSVFWKN